MGKPFYKGVLQVGNSSKEFDYEITSARDLYNAIRSDLSNNPVSGLDIIGTFADYGEKHAEDVVIEFFYDFGYASKDYASDGVKIAKYTDLTRKTLKWGGRTCNFISTAGNAIDCEKKISNPFVTEKGKYEQTCAFIGGTICGVAGEAVGGVCASWSGPFAIAAGIAVGAISTSVGRVLGGIAGGLIYDIHQLNETVDLCNGYARPYMNNYPTNDWGY